MKNPPCKFLTVGKLSVKQHAKTREALQKKTVKINEAIKVNKQHTVSARVHLDCASMYYVRVFPHFNIYRNREMQD